MSSHTPKRSAQILRFTTQGLSPDNRIQLWEGHNARALIPLDVRTLDPSPIRARQSNLHLPSIRMADVTGSSQFVERSEAFISSHPTGMMAIFFALDGDAFFYHPGGHLSLRPGQAVLYDADRPFVRGFAHGVRELVLTIPRQLYAELVGSTPPALPAVFNFSADGGTHERALARLLGRTMQALTQPEREPGTGPGVDLARTEEEALGLLRLILTEPAGSPVGLLASARDFIARNLSNADLSPGLVAVAVGVSERHLSRLFAEQDTTVGRHILDSRLDLARDRLASPDHDGFTVADVAAGCGFASQSHFSRSFRDRFGVTPLQWRKQARSAHPHP